jgi:hypothetical protein
MTIETLSSPPKFEPYKARKKENRFIQYRNGGEGFIKWAEENVCLPIYSIGSVIPKWVPIKDFTDEKHPVTGRSFKDIWNSQKEVVLEALRMENGIFIYVCIVLCWMRGEGKSLLACLIQLWKFFCWPRQQIMLGANSKEQTKFVHYDIMRDIIRNSPNLLKVVGDKNIQEKEIRLTNRKGEAISVIRSISTASGIVSNITGYTFSEIFDMKNPKFYVQLDGSVRNIPNALGVIDSTVSDKKHVLYQLFEGWREGKLKTVFFSYRFSREGKSEDFWNPHMTQGQLDDYKIKFPFGEFERYFQNLWEAGTVKPFTDDMLEETNIIAYNENLMDHGLISEKIEEKRKIKEKLGEKQGNNIMEDSPTLLHRIDVIQEKMTTVESIYSLSNYFGVMDFAPLDSIQKLSNLFRTNFAIGVGLDMSDPLAVYKRARTILTFTAKGLINSKFDRSYLTVSDRKLLKYVYFLIGLVHIEDGSVDTVKEIVGRAHKEYNGIDSFSGERWGGGDLGKWLEYKAIPFELVVPNYGRQREFFKELYMTTKEGRFKKPILQVPGISSGDILLEEMDVFYHDPDKHWFGSPQKDDKYGVQDDSVFSLGWSMWGMREIGPEKFRERKTSVQNMFGTFYPDPSRK